MDKKFGLLVPQKAYANHYRAGRSAVAPPRLIGRLPEDAYILLFVQLPLADAVNLARTCRKVAALSADERVWTRKLAILKYSGPTPEAAQRLLDAIEEKKRLLLEQQQAQAAQSAHASSSGNVQELDRKRRSDLIASPPTISRAPSTLHRHSLSQSSYPTSTIPSFTNTVSTSDTNSSFGIGEEDEDEFGDFSTASAPASGKATGLGLTTAFTNIAFDETAPSSTSAAAASPSRAKLNGNLPLQAPLQPKVKRKEDDLLMLFDDDEMEDIGMATVSPVKVAAPIMPTTTPTKTTLNRSTSINGTPILGSPTGFSSSSMMHKASPAPTRDLFKAYYTALIPYYLSLQSHTTNSLVFSHPTLTPLARAQLLSTLTRLTNSESIAPTRKIATLSIVRRNVQSSTDYFEASTLAQFERAANGNLQRDMRETTAALFELNGGYSVLQVYINKIPLFYDQSWDPLKNLTKTFGPGGDLIDGIDFSAMDAFMAHVLAIVEREGTVIARVFPPDTDVLVTFADRIANDVLADYIISLLSAAQDLEAPLFLLTTAACFGQAMRLVDTIVEIRPLSKVVTRSSVEKVILRMYEQHMTAYLKEELQWARTMLANICDEWDRKMADQALRDDPQFLASQNVQQVKRNILAGFTKALLLPVTIVPKTVAFGVNALTYGGSMALSAVSGGLVGGNSTPKPITTASAVAAAEDSVVANGSIKSSPSTASSSFVAPASRGFGMLLSLDTAMQLIQADRDCLKRIQTFASYSGVYGMRVKSTIEEVFIVLCQTLGEQHLKPAFTKAIAQMDAYRPAEHAVDESVTPLVQFFELVHIGDTIAQMLQVYYDRELTGYVDKNDFLSMVVREKKRFENTLDDAVAAGLNSGVSILMEQAEHILRTQQDIRDFAPELPSAGSLTNGHKAEFDVTDIEGPSAAAQAVVECLRSHCDMLKGSTDKAILDVFHQEVGLRLHGILLKHFKRSIVSIPGGFQVIADLNLYTSFVSSLKLPSVNPYFVALKMAANVFIIDSPRDLGMMARDLDRYEGTLRIEDIMEMVQCRTDWKRIERLVEKEVFGFKAEDCVVM